MTDEKFPTEARVQSPVVRVDPLEYDTVTVLSAEIQDIVTVNSISNVSKVITTTFELSLIHI